MSRPPLAEPVPGLPGAFWSRVALSAVEGPNFLTPAETALFSELGTDKRRREWLAGRLAARSVTRALGAGGCSILRNEEGAPTIEGPGGEAVDLAITHGRAHAAAIGTHRQSAFPHVGIDWVDGSDLTRLRRIAGRVLDDRERALVGDESLPLMLAWGAREAVAKATRTGMFMYALGQVHLTGFDPTQGSASVDVPGVAVHFSTGPEGALVVVAGVSAEARAHANRWARG